MSILVVEDDKKIASFLVKGLRQSGYSADLAQDGDQGLTMAQDRDYQAAIVDIMLPGRDGISLVQQLRLSKPTPVIFLSAKRELDDRLRGLQAGGDDYLTKPFSFTELLARLQALLRRASPGASVTTLACGNLRLDLIRRQASRDGQTMELHSKEFSLLELLLRHQGHPVSKTMILEHVWDYHFDPQTNVVDVLVSRLRAKVDREHAVKLIQTLRGVGYVLKTGGR